MGEILKTPTPRIELGYPLLETGLANLRRTIGPCGLEYISFRCVLKISI